MTDGLVIGMDVGSTTVKAVVINPDTLEILYGGKTIAEILDMSIEEGVSFFEDQPPVARKVDVLNELAGRVRLLSLPPGKPVFRQGDRPEAFYIVRKGTFEVVEEDPETGRQRVITTLGRGQSFGELALLKGSARTATVRPVEHGELFEIDKATFGRLLADTVAGLDLAPTLQQAAELRDIKVADTT